jgi:hypothetical protein
VLNRGEAVNALKRAIYSGRVAPMQARRNDEMQAVAGALSLLANIIMAWNTSQMQAALDHWPRRQRVVPQELIGRIAPTRLEGINLRGVFRFPVERYAAQLLPSQTARKREPPAEGATSRASKTQQKPLECSLPANLTSVFPGVLNRDYLHAKREDREQAIADKTPSADVSSSVRLARQAHRTENVATSPTLSTSNGGT